MVLFLILAIALILRLYNLNQSLWLDEAVQAITSKGPFAQIFLELRGDFHPPLYHLLMWFWVRVFGNSEISLRMPSVLAGVGTVWAVYKIGQLISGQWLKEKRLRLPIIASLFLATAPFHIYYSQEARMYSLGTFLASLSILFFLKLLRPNDLGTLTYASSKLKSADCVPPKGRNFDLKGEAGNVSTPHDPTISKFRKGGLKMLNSKVEEKKAKLGYIFFTTGLLFIDYYGLLLLFGQIIYLILSKKYRFLTSCFVCGFLFLFWLPMFLVQLRTGQLATMTLPEWGKLTNLSFFKALPLTFIKFSLGRITIFDKSLYLLTAICVLTVFGLIIGKGFLKKNKIPITDYQLLITIWFLFPIIIAWLVSFFIPNYQPFRLILTLPAFYLLLSIGLNQEKNIFWQKVGISLVLLVNLISVSVYFFNPFFWREDWRGLVWFLEKEGNQSAAAVLPSQTSSWPWKYYSTGELSLLPVSAGLGQVEDKDLENLRVLLSGKEKVDYIRYLVPLFDAEEKIDFWLKAHNFVKIGKESFNQLEVEEWVKQKS